MKPRDVVIGLVAFLLGLMLARTPEPEATLITCTNLTFVKAHYRDCYRVFKVYNHMLNSVGEYQ